MSVLLTLAFLVAIVWLLAKAEEKGVLHTGGCPCCHQGAAKSALNRRRPHAIKGRASYTKKGGVLRNAAFFVVKCYGS